MGNNRFKKKFKKKPTLKTVAKELKKLEKEVELKWIDSDVDFFHCTNVATLTVPLVGLAKGDGPSNRTADQITTTSVQFRVLADQDIAQLASVAVRMVLFWDRQANHAVPAFGDVFEVSSIPGGAGQEKPTVAMYNRDNSDRFKILYDHVFTIGAQGWDGTDYIPESKYIHGKVKASRDVKYLSTSNTGGIADILTNSMYCFFFSDIPVADVHGPNILYNFRVYFKDP